MSFEVQQTRWDRLIRRVSGSIGPGSRVSETLSELFPVLDVESVPSELLFLSDVKTAQGAQTLVGVAARFNHIQIFNPVDSGKLVTLTQVILSCGSSELVRFGTSEVALTTDVGNVIPRDTRAGILARLSTQVRSENLASGLPLFGQARVEAAVSFVHEGENDIAVLAPGTGYTYANSTANLSLIVSFFWRERPALESELLF